MINKNYNLKIMVAADFSLRFFKKRRLKPAATGIKTIVLCK